MPDFLYQTIQEYTEELPNLDSFDRDRYASHLANMLEDEVRSYLGGVPRVSFQELSQVYQNPSQRRAMESDPDLRGLLEWMRHYGYLNPVPIDKAAYPGGISDRVLMAIGAFTDRYENVNTQRWSREVIIDAISRMEDPNKILKMTPEQAWQWTKDQGLGSQARSLLKRFTEFAREMNRVRRSVGGCGCKSKRKPFFPMSQPRRFW